MTIIDGKINTKKYIKNFKSRDKNVGKSKESKGFRKKREESKKKKYDLSSGSNQGN